MKLKPTILPAIALTLAGLGGTQAAQAQRSPQAASALATDPTNTVLQLWAEGDQRLLQNGKLKLSYKAAFAQIDASGIPGPSPADIAAEAKAERALDRASLPLITAWLERKPAAPAVIDKAVKALIAHQSLHAKNVATVIGNLERAGMKDAALMYSIADDLKQGGTLAGFDLNHGGKLNAILDHYTGLEAGKIYDKLGMDIQIQRSGSFIDMDFKKKVINIPGWYLRPPQPQDPEAMILVKLKVAQAYRRHAAEQTILVKPPMHTSDITYNLGQYGNAGRAFEADQIAHGKALSDSVAQTALLSTAAARLVAMPPEPEPAAAAKPASARPRVRGLKR